MNGAKPRQALSFFSESLDRHVYSHELPQLTAAQLQVLRSEVIAAIAKADGDIDWLEVSSPAEWPDEDWPRRLRRFAAYLRAFALAFDQFNSVRAAEDHNQRLLHDLCKQKAFARILLELVKDRLGYCGMIELRREAQALAQATGKKLRDY